MRIHYIQSGVEQEQFFYTLIAHFINVCVCCCIHIYSNAISNERHKSYIYILTSHAYAEIVTDK